MEKKSIARLLYVINLSVLVSCLFVGILVFSLGQLFDVPPQEVPFVCGVEDMPSPKILIGDALKGERLFKDNCAVCHNSSSEALVGPGLANISKRRSFDWIVRWVHNPQKVIKSGDMYAHELFEKFNVAEMTAFPLLKEEEVSYILEYLDN